MTSLTVVCGPPGVGKSTLSKELVSNGVIDAVRLSSDDVAIAIRDECKILDEIDPTCYLRCANDAMLNIWNELLSIGVNCIHDAAVPNMNRWERLASIAAANYSDLDVICLDASDDLLATRVSERKSRQLINHNEDSLFKEIRIARQTYNWLYSSDLYTSFIKLNSESLGVTEMVDQIARLRAHRV